jgi:hypothetical protein
LLQCSKLFCVRHLPWSSLLCYLFENKRFQGPPIGDMIKKRQAEILAEKPSARLARVA